MARKKRPIGRDAGLPGNAAGGYTGGQGHQTIHIQGGTDALSRGHAEHDAKHRRPMPKKFGSPGTPGAPEGGGPR